MLKADMLQVVTMEEIKGIPLITNDILPVGFNVETKALSEGIRIAHDIPRGIKL